MFSTIAGLILALGSVAPLLLGINFSLGPTKEAKSLIEAGFVFAAFFFLLLGLHFIVGSGNDDSALVGAFLASLALTFFWTIRKRKS
jgi:hypothetical protein